ncbi:glycosyltransferase family 9 protein [Myxococcota bacterium]|nr:glycosyltransferase family 9 protein [Myxococcota bacterium]
MPAYPIDPLPFTHPTPRVALLTGASEGGGEEALLTLSACANPLERPPRAERILVIRLGALGDVARTMPAVARLAKLYPDARISWLVEPAAQPLVNLGPAVDEVLVFPRDRFVRAVRRGHFLQLVSEARQVARTLREGQFDLVIDFHGLLKSGILSLLTRAPIRVAWAAPTGREGSQWAATHRAKMHPGRWSRHERNAALVSYLGDSGGAGSDFQGSNDAGIRVDPEASAALRTELSMRGAGVVLHPGSSRGTPYKRWPVSHFVALARALRQASGRPCLITSGPDRVEQDIAHRIAEESGSSAEIAPGNGTVAELVALLTEAPLVVAGDSGPLQLAAVLGTPVVQILGPTDPVENAPHPRAPSRVLRVPPPCSPCRSGCSEAPCMQAVDVDRVLSAALDVLEETGQNLVARSIGESP